MIQTTLIPIRKRSACASATLINYGPGYNHALFIFEAQKHPFFQLDIFDKDEKREFLVALRPSQIPDKLQKNRNKVKVIIDCLDHLELVVETLVNAFPKSKITLCIPFKDALRVVKDYPQAKTFTQRRIGISFKKKHYFNACLMI